MSSIIYAISESGLDIYKFGGVATLVKGGVEANKRGILLLKENLKRGLHTLFLLQYIYEENYMMHPYQGVKILVDDKGVRKSLIRNKSYIIVMKNLGYNNEFKKAYTLEEINDIKKIKGGVSILLITGKLHFRELDYINTILRD